MGTNCWNYRYRRRRRWWWRWRTKAGAEQKARDECDTIRLAFLFTVKNNYMDMNEIIWTRVSEYPARWDNPVIGLLCLHVLPLSCQRLTEGRKRSLEYCSTLAILVQGPEPLSEEMKRKLERTKCYLLRWSYSVITFILITIHGSWPHEVNLTRADNVASCKERGLKT